MDTYPQLEELAKRLVDVDFEIEDLESSAATPEEDAELQRLLVVRDELRAAIGDLEAQNHQLALERLLDALTAGTR